MISDSLSRHGNLELLARDEASRWGWTAEVRDRDLDHNPGTLYRRADPGAGQLRLRRGGICVLFPYHLPDDPERVRRAIRDVIRTNEYSPVLRERDRE